MLLSSFPLSVALFVSPLPLAAALLFLLQAFLLFSFLVSTRNKKTQDVYGNESLQ